MAFEKSLDALDPVTEPPCIHLRNKAMYVTGSMDPVDPDRAGGRQCWCNQTQNVKGPDSEAVDRRVCIPGRACFQATY